MSAGDWKNFYKACIIGELATVKYYVKEKIDIDYQHPEISRTALVAAIIEGQHEVAIYIIKQGANIRLISCADGLNALEAIRDLALENIYKNILFNDLLAQRSLKTGIFHRLKAKVSKLI